MSQATAGTLTGDAKTDDVKTATNGGAAPEGGETPAAGEPPEFVLMKLLSGFALSQSLYVAARLGLADLLAEGARPVEELARAAGAQPGPLYRVMRLLAGVGVFREEAPRSFGLGPVGVALKSDGPGSMRSMALHLCEAPSWRAWGELMHTVTTSETAFAHANGAEVFPYYAAHPESAEPFNRAMTEMSAAVAGAVVRAYDFSGFGRIVDVGGGHGHLLAEVLRANPEARGVVYDQPEVVEGARAGAAGLGGRLEVEGGDFFESVPASGDAYLLKHIIHDWDDERALAILRNIRRAMGPEARLLLVEWVVPEGDEPSMAKFGDVHMMVMTGGQERTAEEYARLFERAGFRLTRVVETESQMAVIEAVGAG
ncbi:MAG TPA: methyltransferase [Pyrinomonadaceae bacterium]|nr:methyltransferase [Pyrinomonadaceae bacterium]